MTAIAGVVGADGRVYIGGDSCGASGYCASSYANPKVFVNRDMAFGYTSSFRMGQLLEHRFKPPHHDTDVDLVEYMVGPFADVVRSVLKNGGFARKENEEESGGDFLVGYKGRLFHVQGDYSVLESRAGYDAVGCGHDLCKGALFATSTETVRKTLTPPQRIEIALKAAAQFSGGVAPPFTIVSTPS